MESIVRVREALPGDHEIVRYDVVEGSVEGALYTGTYEDVTRVLEGLRLVERYKDADETYWYKRNLAEAEQLAIEGYRFDGISNRTGLECLPLMRRSRGEVKNRLWDNIPEGVTLGDVWDAFYAGGEYKVVYSHEGRGTYRELPGREEYGYVSMVRGVEFDTMDWGYSGDLDPFIELVSGTKYYGLMFLELVEAVARHSNCYDQLEAYEYEQYDAEGVFYDALYQLDEDVLRVLYRELDHSPGKFGLFQYLNELADN